MKMNILVTGANGEYGKLAIEHLLNLASADVKLFGLVRKEADAEALRQKGVEARFGDYADLPSLIKAFEGIDRLLFVSIPNFDIQKNVVEAAKISGIKFIAYTSIYGVDFNKLGLEINHRNTEELIRQSGIPHSFLRNSWYMELHQSFVNMAKKSGEIQYFSGKGKVSGLLKTELAEAGARVILGDNFPEIINLTSKPFYYGEFAEAVQIALNKDITIKEVSKEAYENFVATLNLSPMDTMLGGSMQQYAIAGNNGEEDSTPSTIETILGRELLPLAEAIKTIL